MLEQCDGVLPLHGGYWCIGGVGGIQQLHKGSSHLLCCAALRLAFKGVPLAVVDGEQSMQGLGGFTAPFRPRLTS
ncbi:MAG: hypothetical protein RLZZ515_79 [Cyanobacteriota bacterium]|jgi:hypothetical protein